MPAHILPFSEPLPHLNDRQWDIYLQLRQSLGTGLGLGRVVSRISDKLTLGPDRSESVLRVVTDDDRVALEMVEALCAVTGDRVMHLAPQRRELHRVVLWDINDDCNLGVPRAEAPVHNLRDVLNGSYKPGNYKSTEIGAYQYALAVNARNGLERSPPHPAPSAFKSPARFRPFDPRPTFPEGEGWRSI